jgi:hypothetical protein
MEQVGAGANGKGKGARGRIDKDKQEQVLEHPVIKKKIGELVKLKKAADDASQEFNDAIKAAAEASGFLASTVRSFATARAGENFEDAKRKCEQLSILFEEVGE